MIVSTGVHTHGTVTSRYQEHSLHLTESVPEKHIHFLRGYREVYPVLGVQGGIYTFSGGAGRYIQSWGYREIYTYTSSGGCREVYAFYKGIIEVYTSNKGSIGGKYP